MRPWSTEEIEATVAAYFETLRLELAGLTYVKAEFNERLRRLLDGSKGTMASPGWCVAVPCSTRQPRLPL